MVEEFWRARYFTEIQQDTEYNLQYHQRFNDQRLILRSVYGPGWAEVADY
ncbi:glutathionylspermidine synthase [Candidatus Scalindua japonica]|uniref:Glutathionylspermidine synthase n=1 Tax=Candidatus Scalindua japonica TaxID=1284222 RepID=A0A286U3Y9_9BACT|nr:glutathionylspermidine synthase [Candidatus Scalindua japonica]